MRFFYCGSPENMCNGQLTKTDHIGLKGKMLKAHSSAQQAMTCHVSYLKQAGFTRLSAREYLNPHDGSIRVLTKAIRFGLACRWGKEKSRVQPKRNNGPWIIDIP